MRIQKFEQYSTNQRMALEFINSISNESPLLESKQQYETILKRIIKDLKLNYKLVFMFGTGITLMAPIVEGLVKNMKLNIELTPENIVLLTITSLAIAYVEEKTEINSSEYEELKKESRSLLEELKLRGIGNVIVKKLLNCFKSIVNIFGLLWKHKIGVVLTLAELFTYTALFIPTMNAILFMVNKYDMNLDTLPGNFLSVGVGIATTAAKNALIFILDKLKLKIDKREAEEIEDELKVPKTQDAGKGTEIITERK